ncbi:BgTH12-05344 [Blumeria graminis f. sp. triticale]|nr:BgTH12-05344 [Blumeria graminis f. sp. triticale]
MSNDKKQSIVFFHPDLGIGGAERLIIDAAVGLQRRGHQVVIFTSRCDPQHCFDEARDGTLDVRVRGDTIVPPSILCRFSIICAILRQFHLIISTYYSSELVQLCPNAFVIDQLSAGLPWLAYLFPNTRILFYCHFPDLLMVQDRSKWWKRIYRIPFDFLEEWSMTYADSIVVNSNFTKGVVKRTFSGLVNQKKIQIIYPSVNTSKYHSPENDSQEKIPSGTRLLLSINRFERKKDIALAIKAYAGLESHQRQNVKLIIAGGYDNEIKENVMHHIELVNLAESFGLQTETHHDNFTTKKLAGDIDVFFLLSVRNSLKDALLRSARLLIYTPSNEHFGIVPLEAMLAGVPVLAANTGGPLETVVDGKTGWLCSPDDEDQWTKVIYNVLFNLTEEERLEIGNCGTERVKHEFSDAKMAERLEEAISSMSNLNRKSCQILLYILGSIAMGFLDILYFCASRYVAQRIQFGTLQLQPLVLSSLIIGAWTGYLAKVYSGEY